MVVTAASIPLGDAPALEAAGRRTRIVRALLAAAIAGIALGAFFLARTPNLLPTPLLPPGSNGIIVIDLSSSVEAGTLDRLYAGLTQLAATRERFGLVIFSNRAYEALPPNTPARELRPIARFFHALSPAAASQANVGPGFNNHGTPVYPRNPWASGFSSGTEISSGLVLARTLILNNAVTRPSVWLMSDLADDPIDRPSVVKVAKSYGELGIALHIVALDPRRSDALFFDKLLGARGSLIKAAPSGHVRLKSEHAFPTGFIFATVALTLLLAANELWTARLEWGVQA